MGDLGLFSSFAGLLESFKNNEIYYNCYCNPGVASANPGSNLTKQPPFIIFLLQKDSMKEPLRAMLDTNTYEILYRKNLPQILNLIESNYLIVYGCKTIRDELREIPKNLSVEGRSYRQILLAIYDKITKNHSYPVESLAETLAEEYWKAYKGGVAKRKIMPDFLIVAIATIHRLDIIVSEDEKTMKSGPALRAYKQVNTQKELQTPRFIKIEELTKP